MVENWMQTENCGNLPSAVGDRLLYAEFVANAGLNIISQNIISAHSTPYCFFINKIHQQIIKSCVTNFEFIYEHYLM
jgi:hypothetical protein